MSYRAALNLINAVQVARETVTSDGMGGTTVATVLTTLSRAALWKMGGNERYVSDEVAAISSHVLACLATDDVVETDTVIYDSETYTVTSHPDDVMQRGRVQVVPLKQVD